MTRFCSECGVQLKDDQLVCPACGAPAGQPEESAPVSEPLTGSAAADEPARETTPAPMLTPGVDPQAAAQSKPRPPYAKPINADRPQYQYAAPDESHSDDKKSYLALGIIITAVIVISLAAIIILILINPFGWFRSSDSEAASDPTAQTATEAPADPGAVTDADLDQLRQMMPAIVNYGYSATAADLDSYLGMTYEYASADDREGLRKSVSEHFYDSIAEFKRVYGSDYTVTIAVRTFDVLTDGDLADVIATYGLLYTDADSIEAAVNVHGDVTVSGSIKAERTDWTWQFVRADGAWYAVGFDGDLSQPVKHDGRPE